MAVVGSHYPASLCGAEWVGGQLTSRKWMREKMRVVLLRFRLYSSRKNEKKAVEVPFFF
jgi:hypothetical protein